MASSVSVIVETICVACSEVVALARVFCGVKSCARGLGCGRCAGGAHSPVAEGRRGEGRTAGRAGAEAAPPIRSLACGNGKRFSWLGACRRSATSAWERKLQVENGTALLVAKGVPIIVDT